MQGGFNARRVQATRGLNRRNFISGQGVQCTEGSRLRVFSAQRVQYTKIYSAQGIQCTEGSMHGRALTVAYVHAHLQVIGENGSDVDQRVHVIHEFACAYTA